MALTIPPKPKTFDPDIPPPGVRKDYVSFVSTRKFITPRIHLIHTNGASVEGSIESAKRHAELRYITKPDGTRTATTLPTFQVDRDGDAGMFIPMNRAQNACYKINNYAISCETADTGYKADPTISGFTEAQMQILANISAYAATIFKIPLSYPTTWDGSGTASHTEPFTYPYWTNSKGKICPGQKKKAQVRDVIIPHARAIYAAWQGSTPIPIPPPTSEKPPTTPITGDIFMNPLVLKYGGSPTAGWSGYVSRDGGWTMQAINDMHHARLLQCLGAVDAKTGKKVADVNWADVTHTNNINELKAWLTPVAV